jgi:hypothetical protein
MHAGVAERPDLHAANGTEVADVACDEGVVVFEGGRPDQGVTRQEVISWSVGFDKRDGAVADRIRDGKQSQLKLTDEISGYFQLRR